MADPTPSGSGLGPILDYLGRLEQRIRELEKPTGTQYANAVGNLTAFGSIGSSAQAFIVPTDWADVSSAVITVPDGFTDVQLNGFVGIGAWNGSATGDYLYVRCMIDGTPGASMPDFAGASAYASVQASAIRTLTGLTPGTSIAVSIQARAASGWGASASNIANIDVTANFKK